MNKIRMKLISFSLVSVFIFSLVLVSPLFSVPVNAATNQLTFVDVGSRTYSTGTGKVTVLILGRPTCGNCHATISGLSNADWINSNDVQIVFADVDGNETSVIQQFRDEIDCDRIMFCAQEQSVVGSYKSLLRSSVNTSGSITLPVIVYYDKYGNTIDVTTGYQNSNSIQQYAVKAGFESALAITSHPLSFTGYEGITAIFEVGASGTGLKYQWQVNTSGTWKNSSLTGYNTSTLSVPVIASRNGYKFRCVVKDASNRTVISNEATLTVTTTPVSITTQPKNYTGAVGSTAKFTVAAQGSGLKYQWQTYSSGTWKNSSLSGYNTATLSVPVTQARDGYKFRCVVTDSSNKKATTNTVTLRVSATATLAIKTQPANYSGPVGSTAKFKVGTGWVNSSLSGYNTATLSVPVTKARHGYNFRCVVTDSSGKKVVSNKAILRVTS